MQILLVHVHPEPKSFNGALTRTAVEGLTRAGHSVVVSDLYAMRFDPVSDRRNFTTVKNAAQFNQQEEELHATAHDGFAPEIEAELGKVEACDLMIWQFPFWWYGVPAMMKGWVDRVLAFGRTYAVGRSHATEIFRGKRALLSLTTGADEASYRKGARNGDIHAMLRSVRRGTGDVGRSAGADRGRTADRRRRTLRARASQNSAVPGVRAKGMTSRMLATPVTNISMRSKPRPKPACGTVP